MKKILLILSIFLLFGCENAEEDDIRNAVYHGFGTPISETDLQLCYKNKVYRIQLNKKFLCPERIIPILKDPTNPNSTEILKCNDKIDIRKR